MGYIYTKSGKLAKRLYFGAVLLFEGLYYTFKNRVLTDGGTFVENELPTISQYAKLLLTPNAYKAGKLYSAVPNDGTGDFTVDRNSTATYIGQDGLIKTALSNVPRIDWSTGEAALLVEPQSTNLLLQSDNYSSSSWSKQELIITSNATTSPNGLVDADKIIPNSVSSPHQINRLSIVASQICTMSVYAKEGEINSFYLLDGDSGFHGSIFNLTTGTVTNQGTGIGSIESLSNGWYRCITVVNTTGFRVYISVPSPYIGDDTSGIYLWGSQFETGSTVSSYIPTNGTTVTRLADDISVPTPAGVTSITETIDGVDQTPITTIPATYSLPVGNINKVTML